MSRIENLRVMWLLNHSSARKFEVPMLKRIGISQIFLPKQFPAHHNFRSATIDWTEDQALDLPLTDLEKINATDWYGNPSIEAWTIANKYFDVIFFIMHSPEILQSIARHYEGIAIWRAYGLDSTINYGGIIKSYNLSKCFEKMGQRLYFGEAYSHLGDTEGELITRRRCYLPLGLPEHDVLDGWQGSDRIIYFVCPDVGFNIYYKKVYDDFKRNFSGIPYVVAGAQPVHVNDRNVLGYVTNERHAYNMAQSRVMYYHSREPNHIHYHPFEAIRAGMPLVFMAGGMLDRMGGVGLPGRCHTVAEARRKIKRILADDWSLIESIRSSQAVLLDPMRPDNCEPAWREGFKRIAADLATWRSEQAQRPARVKRKRVAIIVPVAYRGGTLRAAFCLAQVLHLGSRQWGEDAEVVFFHLDDPKEYPESEFADLPFHISRRPFNWKWLEAPEAKRAMRYAGHSEWEPATEGYIIPDDGMRQAMDCDLWLVVSDRLSCPLLPLRPTVLMVYDYLPRYVDVISGELNQSVLAAARSAQRVLVTTEFTRQDALQYAGLDPSKVAKVPMLAPEFPLLRSASQDKEAGTYFVWSTNAAPHKNHAHAAAALRIYYEELEGQLECRVTGVNTRHLLASKQPHLEAMGEVFDRSKKLKKRVKWLGELPDTQYRRMLTSACFLWHAGRIDNGTFAVIEAACFGVPALSSDYPAMREIDAQFTLNLAWMNPDDPQQMARQLKKMEQDASARRGLLPTVAQLQAQRLESHATNYWKELRRCF